MHRQVAWEEEYLKEDRVRRMVRLDLRTRPVEEVRLLTGTSSGLSPSELPSSGSVVTALSSSSSRSLICAPQELILGHSAHD